MAETLFDISLYLKNTDNSNSENIINFTKDLQKNGIYAGTDYSKTDAKFIGQKDYDSIIDRGRLQTRTKTGFDIDAFIQEAKRKYEEIKNATNPANIAYLF